MYQGGLNVPLVVAGAGVTRTGQREVALVSGVDLFATIADLAGTGVTARHDGLSFRSLLGAAGPSPRSVAYTEFFRQARPGGGGAGPAALANAWAVRDARYKLIQIVDGASSLYDLAVDPYEPPKAAVISPAASSSVSVVRPTSVSVAPALAAATLT